MKDLRVHLKWVGGDNVGQEVLFVKGRYDDMLSVKASVIVWVHFERPQDHDEVKRNSNHTVLEAGFGNTLTAIRNLSMQAFDANGHLETYSYEKLRLNPVLPDGKPELTSRDFYRSLVFPGQWEEAGSESW